MKKITVISLFLLSILSVNAQNIKDLQNLLKDESLEDFTTLDQNLESAEDLLLPLDSLLDNQVNNEEEVLEVKIELPAPVDFAPDYSDSIIIARIEAISKDELPLRFDPKIRGFIDYFSIRNRNYTRKMIRRSEAYFPIIEEILEKYDMPESIKYLAIVESGLDPKIRSWAGAMGLWQFMPATGKVYDLDYDYYIDERLDPYKSTEAACRYLRQLYNMFGDWELALGAYNCGPGNMRKAIRRSGYKKTFAEVYDYLPRETRSYVPQFMAVNYVMNYTEEHNLFIENWEKESLPEHEALVCNQYLDLVKLCELSGVCKADIVKLNPEIKRDAISADWKNYSLRMPVEFFLLGEDSIKDIMVAAGTKGGEKLNYDYRNPNAIDLSGSNQIIHRVRSGDNLGKIAGKYGVRVKDIKSWNRLRSSTIYPGQRLKILVKKKQKTTAPSISKNTTAKKKDKVELAKGEKRIHKVSSGEVLGLIASKYDVSVRQIKQWNNLSSNTIHIGQKLTIYGGAVEEKKSKQETKETVTKKDFKNVEKQKYTVTSGDALYTIAKKFNMSVQDLKELNGLNSNSIKPGLELLVFKSNSSTKVVEGNKEETNNSKKTHVVKSGDSLWSISKQYNGVTIDKLRKLNNLKSNDLDIGQELRIE